MGKRTNTILQSAFFKLANIMPIDEAVQYMKEAAKKSYSKKGDAVVEMNYKAIDAGVDATHKVEIPASWSNPEPDAAPAPLKGRPATVKMVQDIMNPVNIMNGDSFQYLHSKTMLMDNGKLVLLLTKNVVQLLQFLNGMLLSVSSVTSVHSYVHMLQFVHSSLMKKKLKLLQKISNLQILTCSRYEVYYERYST